MVLDMMNNGVNDRGGTRSGNERRQEKLPVILNGRSGKERRSGFDRRIYIGQRRFVERRDIFRKY